MAMVVAFLATGSAFADIIHVPGDHPTITQAIASSADGDEIHIEAGTYYESNIFISSANLTISGATNGDEDVRRDREAIVEITNGRQVLVRPVSS